MYVKISDAIRRAEKESNLRPEVLETVKELKEMQQTFKRGTGGDTLRACVQHLEFMVSSEIKALTKIMESSEKVKKELQALYYLVEALDKESVGPVSISAD